MKIPLFALVFCIVMIIPSVFAEEKVPDWVKNNAGWWADNHISDSEFVNAIEFLIKEGIIKIDAKAASEKSDIIPDWVKYNAAWWANGKIPDIDFLSGIHYMIKNGIIWLKNQTTI